MSLESFARTEMEAAGLFDKDADYDGEIAKDVMELIKKFCAQGHTMTSAQMTLSIFAKLAAFKPLRPLTGADSEWTEVEPGIFQNKRCSHVFKEADGRAYDSNGRVFEDPNGIRWTSRESHVFIEFPYTPVTEIVKREAA